MLDEVARVDIILRQGLLFLGGKSQLKLSLGFLLLNSCTELVVYLFYLLLLDVNFLKNTRHFVSGLGLDLEEHREFDSFKYLVLGRNQVLNLVAFVVADQAFNAQ